MKWIVLYSQTGSEIANLSKHLNRKPDLILTNNKNEQTYSSDLINLDTPITIGDHRDLMDIIRSHLPSEIIVTLHGYLKIIPQDVCEKYSIYNGHPGLITTYPELKGHNPQIRTWNGDYKEIGSVVHKVTDIVDDGEVLSYYSCSNRAESLDDLYDTLKQTSFQSWINFFNMVDI